MGNRPEGSAVGSRAGLFGEFRVNGRQIRQKIARKHLENT
jgi:hypothetical protein